MLRLCLKLSLLPKTVVDLSILFRKLSEDSEENHAGVARTVVNRYIAENGLSRSNPLKSWEADSLGHLLCGLTATQWEELVADEVFKRITHVFRFVVV